MHKLYIDDVTVFTGKISHDLVQTYDNLLSVSNSESFGVDVIEASACEKPIIVSDVGGLSEVVAKGITGIIVLSRNAEKTAEAIERLIFDKSLRDRMGKAGRERVSILYD